MQRRSRLNSQAGARRKADSQRHGFAVLLGVLSVANQGIDQQRY